jgi:hypothetical protein
MIGWAEAAGIVGSVAAVGLTIYKILSLRKTASSDDVKGLKTDVAVLKSQMEDVREDVDKVENHYEKTQDLLIKLLTEDREG